METRIGHEMVAGFTRFRTCKDHCRGPLVGVNRARALYMEAPNLSQLPVAFRSCRHHSGASGDPQRRLALRFTGDRSEQDVASLLQSHANLVSRKW